MRGYERLNLAQLVGQDKPEKQRFDPKKIERLKTYSDVVLGILAVAGILTVTVLAPNALQALKIFEGRRKRPGRPYSPAQSRQKLTRTFYYLRKRGQIEFRRKGSDYEIFLTNSGKREVRRFEMETLRVPRQEKWDGRFWQVAADIPTKDYRRGADALRRKLKEMKFYPLQRTLWFYPYDPRTELEFICQSYGIGRFVTAMKIAELDPADEKALTSFFNEQKII